MVTHKNVASPILDKGMFPARCYLAYRHLGVYFYRLAYETIYS
jgi:hypothetical protein